MTGCILSIGRILGESAALLFTAGSAHMLYNFFEGMHNAGATLTVALYFYAKESSDTGVVFAIAAILMLLTMLINLIADLVGDTSGGNSNDTTCQRKRHEAHGALK